MKTPRKLRIPNGQPPPPLTQLKLLPEESRARICKWLEQKSCTEVAELVGREFGIVCPVRKISSFGLWQRFDDRVDDYNVASDKFTDLFKRLNPNASREKVRDAGIAFFLAETAMHGDQEAFVGMADLDLRERTVRTKARQEEHRIAIAARRVRLLENKAAQARQAAKQSHQRVPAEEMERRMKAVFGMD